MQNESLLDTLIVGVDPDLSGAVVLLRGGRYVTHFRIPTREHNKRNFCLKSRVDCFEIQRRLGALLSLHEQQPEVFMEWAPVIMQGKSAQVSSQHRTIGDIEAVFACHGLDVSFVEARDWKKAYGLLGKKKHEVIPVANQLCGTSVRLKKDVAVAEAAMIARYGHKYT